MNRRALVVGDGSAAFVLPALRALGRAGWSVSVAQPAPGLLTASRWCARWHEAPRAEEGLERWVQAVERALVADGCELVLPADDIELLALSSCRAHLSALVPYPSHDVVVRTVDKLTVTQAAERAGLGVPRTLPATEQAVRAVSGEVVVKARLHWTPGAAGGDRHLPVQLVRDPAAAAQAVDRVRAAGGEAVLQEVVDGQLMAVSLVLDRSGRLVAASHQVTERTTVRRTSARARTVPPDPELEERVVALLADLGWWGLANLQFLRGADGIPRLIDVNGRFYGSLALAVSAGADLPRAWVEAALGSAPAQVLRARPGARFQALDEDLLALRADPAGGRRAAAEALGYGLRATHSIWDARDPGPFAQRQQQRVRRVAGRATAAAARRARR